MSTNFVRDLNELDPKLDLEKTLSDVCILYESNLSTKCLIKWCVPKLEFEKQLSNVGGYLSSSYFYFGEASRLYFTLYPNGKDESSKNGVYLEITTSKVPDNAYIEGVVFIDGRNNSKTFSTDSNTTIRNIDKFDDMRNLSRFINEKALIIHCSLKMEINTVGCTFDDKKVYHKIDREDNRYKERLYKEMPYSDVTFHLKGGKIKAHKVILAEVPHFDILFTEDSQQEIHLDMKYHVFEYVLQFIYTKTIPSLDFALASELYIVANTLEIVSLKNICSSYLAVSLTERNVVIVLQLADQWKDIDLKKECFLFIKNSNADVLARDAVFI